MSAGTLPVPHDTSFYVWNNTLNDADYIRVRYEITATCAGMDAAIGMAMDQSVGTTHIHNYLDAKALSAFCTRVRSVTLATPLPQASEPQRTVVRSYSITNSAYHEVTRQTGSFIIEMSVPLCLLAGKTGQLWNILVGELPRLGFITQFSLAAAPLPSDFGTGPVFGIAGIRALTGCAKGPLLCRAMRPATGAADTIMATINHDVLLGGFHIVKDDELQVFATFELFARHLRAMLTARDAARITTGENKLYIANLICEPWELNERWDLCCSLGVDGVLVAPWIQGLGTLSYLARQRRMLIFAHNTVGELFTRHPEWNIHPAVTNHWLRVLGADIIVTEGDFGDTDKPTAVQSAALKACISTQPHLAPTLPVLQGGKNPDGLPRYIAAVGSDDFMLIVASWVDNYPEGIIAGAMKFRSAIDAMV